MASFAKIDLNLKVIEVVSVHNNELLDSNGIEQEALGIEFLTKHSNYPFWKQTSYNGSFRKNYAGIGFTYDVERDAFIPPKSYPSWILNEDTCNWVSPTPYPEDEQEYSWNESTESWDAIP